MKDGAIYLLSRQVKGDHGESYMQNVTVFASSRDAGEVARRRPVRVAAEDGRGA